MEDLTLPMLITTTFFGGKLDCYGMVLSGLPDVPEMTLLNCKAGAVACRVSSETSKEAVSLRFTGSGLFLLGRSLSWEASFIWKQVKI